MNIFSRIRTKKPSESIERHPEFGVVTFISSKRTRSLRLSVKPFQGLQVKLPWGYPKTQAWAFIGKKSEWIKLALQQARITEAKSEQFFFSGEKPKLKEIRNSLVTRLDELAVQFGFSYQKVSLRDQKSRWGSCSAQNNISLNQKLYFLPDELRDYVLIHELAHTVQKNHGPNFWIILYNIFGKRTTLDSRKKLRDYEFLFHQPPLELL
ncbi:MAG: M48 family metallopeptidase [Candidatus Marinimicrobia bacterium]|nr:M48 family metallopeptidase [Candidatus Neomarinimicrobiota bacterium]